MKTERRLKAFTLIEMLIVVGILAILTLIAVPNYKVADTRAKTSRVKADLNAIATAVEAFAVDHNHYPKSDFAIGDKYACSGAWGYLGGYYGLTTPVAYMMSMNIEDPFTVRSDIDSYQGGKDKSYLYTKAHEPSLSGNHYMLFSYGPRRGWSNDSAWNLHVLLGMKNREYFVTREYDPSNGTVSNGLIMRLQ